MIRLSYGNDMRKREVGLLCRNIPNTDSMIGLLDMLCVSIYFRKDRKCFNA